MKESGKQRTLPRGVLIKRGGQGGEFLLQLLVGLVVLPVCVGVHVARGLGEGQGPDLVILLLSGEDEAASDTHVCAHSTPAVLTHKFCPLGKIPEFVRSFNV